MYEDRDWRIDESWAGEAPPPGCQPPPVAHPSQTRAYPLNIFQLALRERGDHVIVGALVRSHVKAAVRIWRLARVHLAPVYHPVIDLKTTNQLLLSNLSLDEGDGLTEHLRLPNSAEMRRLHGLKNNPRDLERCFL
jgi:hypothetical protein